MEEYLGVIKLFAGTFAPQGWLFCDGATLQINQHSALFSIIGATYGGDGRTTFCLPDLRGRIPVGAGQGTGLSNRVVGEKSGSETTTLLINNLPSHSHGIVAGSVPVNGSISATMKVNNTVGDASSPSGKYIGLEGGGVGLYASSSDGTTLATDAIAFNASGLTVNLSNSNTTLIGLGTPINNMQPYIGLNYIICVQGLYPSHA